MITLTYSHSIFICSYMYLHSYLYVYLYVYLYLQLYLSYMYIYIYIYIHIYICIAYSYFYIYFDICILYVYLYLCLFMYMHVYFHLFISIYIFQNGHPPPPPPLPPPLCKPHFPGVFDAFRRCLRWLLSGLLGLAWCHHWPVRLPVTCWCRGIIIIRRVIAGHCTTAPGRFQATAGPVAPVVGIHLVGMIVQICSGAKPFVSTAMPRQASPLTASLWDQTSLSWDGFQF